jgi:RHS repeat-associated protein
VESGLDYFNARYYSPEQGRFVSADPGNAGSDPSDPQTWNGYAYVSGNPLALTDPSGEGLFGDIFGAIGALVGAFCPPCGIGILQGLAIGETVGGLIDVARTGDLMQFNPAALSAGLAPSAYGLDPRFGGLNGLIWGGRQSPFIIQNFGDQTGGFWTTDYDGDPYWYEPRSGTVATNAQMKAAPKPSNLSVAAGCVVASLKDHLLGLGASAGASIATAPLKKPWLGIRDIGGPTNLLSKLGTYFNIRLSSPAAGGGANPQLGTLRAFGAAGRILGPAAWAITGGQVLKAGQDAYSCYSISH